MIFMIVWSSQLRFTAEDLLSDDEYEVPSAHVMQMVNSSGCSSYDCEFVALASYLGVPLITADKKLLREFPEITKSLDSYWIPDISAVMWSDGFYLELPTVLKAFLPYFSDRGQPKLIHKLSWLPLLKFILEVVWFSY